MVRGVVVALLSLCAAPAAAQDYGGRLSLFGDGALGLGGAYGAVADDPAAAWYNPGGLVFGSSGEVTASLILGLTEQFTIDGAFRTAAGTSDVSFNDAASIPFFAGGRALLGPADEAGRKRHALAAVVLTVSDLRREFAGELQTPPPGGAVSGLRLGQRDSLRYYGGSYAYQPTPRLGLGISGFLGIRQLRHEEGQLDATRLDEGGVVSGALGGRLSRVSIDAEYLTFRLGVLWRPAARWSLGLTFQPPSIEVGARGQVAQVFGGTDGSGSAGGLAREDPARVRLPIPWAIRLSTAYVNAPTHRSFLLALDVEVTGPLIDVQVVDVSAFEGLTPLPPAGYYFAPRFSRNTTIDAAVGAEWRIADLVPVRVGVFTSLEPLAAVSVEFQPQRLDQVGGTLALGVDGAGYNFSVGVLGVFGFGTVQRAVLGPAGALQGYDLTAARSTAIFLFVTGGAGAAQRLATDLSGAIR